ncbi:hypothetical protein LXL04_011162 [Taraxacum kok-saghyz]
MRLLSYYMLNSTTHAVPNDYRLKIEVKRVTIKEDYFEPDYLRELLPVIDWKGLVYASKMLGYTDLPDEFPNESMLDSEDFLKKFHHALLELHLEEGALICPETGRRFPVKRGVPNMNPKDNEIPLNDDKSNEKATKTKKRSLDQILPPATYKANITVTYI